MSKNIISNSPPGLTLCSWLLQQSVLLSSVSICCAYVSTHVILSLPNGIIFYSSLHLLMTLFFLCVFLCQPLWILLGCVCFYVNLSILLSCVCFYVNLSILLGWHCGLLCCFSYILTWWEEKIRVRFLSSQTQCISDFILFTKLFFTKVSKQWISSSMFFTKLMLSRPCIC